MAFIEIFNTTFFISLAITLLIISVLFVYVNYHISQQDHKISSMLGLISTMAQEIDFFRNKNSNSVPPATLEKQINIPSLIEVSDDEEEEDEEDEEDEDEEDEEDEEDKDEDDQEEELEDYNSIKSLGIHLIKTDNEIIHLNDKIHSLYKEGEGEEEEDEEGEYNDDDTLESQSTKYIHLNNDNNNLSESDFKKLNIDIDLENSSYKNLPVQKLRNIIVEKGLSKDPSKLKKNEILKLLSSE